MADRGNFGGFEWILNLFACSDFPLWWCDCLARDWWNAWSMDGNDALFAAVPSLAVIFRVRNRSFALFELTNHKTRMCNFIFKVVMLLANSNKANQRFRTLVIFNLWLFQTTFRFQSFVERHNFSGTYRPRLPHDGFILPNCVIFIHSYQYQRCIKTGLK